MQRGRSGYLIDFGEKATSDQLGGEVFPELQFADSGAELLPAVHMVVFVWRLTIQGGAGRLRRHVHITHPGDIHCEERHHNRFNKREVKESVLHHCIDMNLSQHYSESNLEDENMCNCSSTIIREIKQIIKLLFNPPLLKVPLASGGGWKLHVNLLGPPMVHKQQLLCFYYIFYFLRTLETIASYSILVWFASYTKAERRNQIISTAHNITNTHFPSLEDIYRSRCLQHANSIIKDSSHPCWPLEGDTKAWGPALPGF